MKNTNIQWHPAFVSAMQLELKEYREWLLFEKEHNLNTKPLQIDLLVIRKEEAGNIGNEIGEIFRKYNIWEYKSPKQQLDIDSFYKSEAYAGLYKSYGETSDGRKAEDMRRLLTDTSRLKGKLDKEFADSVLEVCLRANEQMIEKLKGDDIMSEALLEIMEPIIEPIIAERERMLEIKIRKEGKAEGKAEGKKEGIHEGIKGSVLLLRSLGHDNDVIRTAIISQYHLSDEEADQYL